MILVLLQLLCGWLLGFGAMLVAPVPEGTELFLGAIGNAIGIIAVAYVVARIRKRVRPGVTAYVATIAGALIGAVSIKMLPPQGFQALLIPLLIGIAAFHMQRKPVI